MTAETDDAAKGANRRLNALPLSAPTDAWKFGGAYF